ncbi:MAG: hypothetical protein U0931_35735 [Vulcanimicrobiota bacterium]
MIPRARRTSLMTRGLSLVEALMANFLLATVILGLMALSGNALRLSATSRAEVSALRLAETELSECREWLQNSPGALASWPGLPGLASWRSHPDFLAAEYRVDLAAQPDYSPFWQREMLYPAGDRRSLDHSGLRAQVRVRWSGGTLKLVSLIADHRRQWRASNPLEISSQPSASLTVAKGGQLELKVKAFNSQGQAEPDAMFTWSVQPGTSCGMIQSQSRDGRQAIFAHQVPKRSGVGFISGPTGSCFIVATCRLWGQERSERLLVNLQ